MKCQNCGRELKNGARFCIACGAQHDHNGQLISGNQAKVDYNKTMMASDMQYGNDGEVDYNKTMMTGSTGFQQYQGDQDQQNFQQYDYSNAGYDGAYAEETAPQKKKISPIMIICPLIIIIALAVSLFGNKKSKKVDKVEDIKVSESVDEKKADIKNEKETKVVKEEKVATPVVIEKKEEKKSTKSNVEKKIEYPKGGYWDAEAEHFYINGEMQKDTWIGDYYVDPSGKKLVSAWTKDDYYVDALGKKAINSWIEFSFLDNETGQRKIGYYYVGDDGKKVRNKTVEGRYLDDTGSYFPSNDEKVKDVEESSEHLESKEKEIVETSKTNNDKKQQDGVKETTTTTTAIAQTTTVYIPPTTYAQAVQTQNVVPAEQNVKTFASDGKSIAYNIVESAIANENITKLHDIVITDQNHTQLALNVNEWNNNNRLQGLSSGEFMAGTNISMTREIKVERNDGKIFSLCEIITKYDGTRAYEVVKTGMTWDASTGEPLDLESIFNSDKYSDFAKKVLNKLKSNKSSIDSEKYEEMIEGGAEELIEYYTWYMTRVGITLVFNKNKIESSKIDGVSFSLTYSESGDNINKLLQSKYKQ